jgi:cation:H+ antiporter
MADLLWAGLGLAILILAGDALVRGAVNSALRLGIPALIVSLTVVAFGTSAPELLVGVQAVLTGAPGIALGNVVGSNIANVLIVLGIPALISRLGTDELDTRKSYLVMLAASALFIVLAFLGPLTWIHGLILLAALTAVLADQGRQALSHRRSEAAAQDVEGADPSMRWWKIIAFLAVGLVGLPVGADLLVDASTNIARTFGISETVIGLTLVAVGTSLPELATSVVAAVKRQADVALGNVIGSNLFNLLGITGVVTLVGPIPVDRSFLTLDLWVMLGASVAMAPFVLMGRRLGRRWGMLFVGVYAVYLYIIV